MVATTRRPVTWVAWIGPALEPSCGAVMVICCSFQSTALRLHAMAADADGTVAFGPFVQGRPPLAAPGRPGNSSVSGVRAQPLRRVIPHEQRWPLPYRQGGLDMQGTFDCTSVSQSTSLAGT